MTHPKPEILALLAGGDLPVTEARSVAEHVAGCEACGGALAEIRRSVAEFRGWAADGEPAAEEIQALHDAVMAQLPRSKQRWVPGWAAALAAVVICASVALWRVEQRPPSAVAGSQDSKRAVEAAAVDGVKSHEDTSSQGPVNRDRGSGKVSAAVRTSNRSVIPGSRSVSLKHDADGEPVLQIATANPNVLILWYVDEGRQKDDDDE